MNVQTESQENWTVASAEAKLSEVIALGATMPNAGRVLRRMAEKRKVKSSAS